MPRLCATARSRREEQPLPLMVAETPDRDRPAAHQCAGRHHQLHDVRPRSAAACVRREESARQSRGTPRPQGREPARTRWPHLPARREHVRDRRRQGGGIARRHHGRRGIGLRRERALRLALTATRAAYGHELRTPVRRTAIPTGEQPVVIAARPRSHPRQASPRAGRTQPPVPGPAARQAGSAGFARPPSRARPTGTGGAAPQPPRRQSCSASAFQPK